MEEDQAEDMATFKQDSLVLKNFIGHGSYGMVYEGQYDGQKVAVKLMEFGEDHDALRTFMQEVLVWKTLDHPNVGKFIGAKSFISNINVRLRPGKTKFKPQSACCLVSEYLNGGTLASFIRRHKKLPFNLVIRLALDVSRGLSYLHSKEIVHRDVKLENLLLDNEKRVKIIDFGTSRFEAANPEDMTGQTGTNMYMAPEVKSCSPYNHKCDVFSFGICLWEIYYCKRVETKLSVRPRISNDCPENLKNLMEQCWEDQKRRPEMAEVVNILEDMYRLSEKKPQRSDRFKGCFCVFKR